jgi:hypothetical protein
MNQQWPKLPIIVFNTILKCIYPRGRYKILTYNKAWKRGDARTQASLLKFNFTEKWACNNYFCNQDLSGGAGDRRDIILNRKPKENLGWYCQSAFPRRSELLTWSQYVSSFRWRMVREGYRRTKHYLTGIKHGCLGFVENERRAPYKRCKPTFLPQYQRPSFITIQNKGQNYSLNILIFKFSDCKLEDKRFYTE